MPFIPYTSIVVRNSAPYRTVDGLVIEVDEQARYQWPVVAANVGADAIGRLAHV
jgi:hypothetical protein